MKLPVSVAVVCKDEEDRIESCLASAAAFADEIVVVDSGSADKTLEIARRFTDKIFSREWKGWRDQKKWAADQCRNEWVLTLDADEAVSDELREEIAAEFAAGPRANGYTMPRKTFYQGRWIRHSGWYPDRKLRLYKRGVARFGGDDPHEVIEVPDPVGHFNGDLIHHTYRDLRHQALQLVRYAWVNADARAARGKRFHLTDLIFRPGWAFFKSWVLQLGFLDGMPGFIIGVMVGYYTFLKYARLWEMGRK